MIELETEAETAWVRLARDLFEAWRGSDDKWIEWGELNPAQHDRWLRVADVAQRAAAKLNGQSK